MNMEDTSSKAMVDIDRAALKTQPDNLRVKFNKSEFNLATYKRGLASVEEQLVFYKKNEVMFCDQIAVLKRDASFKDSEIIALKSEIEKLKKEKECNQIKINKFENASKCLEKLIGSQISDNSRKGVGYNAVPPPPTGLFAPPTIDLSNSGLEEFQQLEFKGYGPKASKSVYVDTSNEDKKTYDTPLVEELVLEKEKQTVFPKQQDKTVRKPVKPKAVNTARPNSAVVNTVSANQANVVKASACWVRRPTKLDSASITLKKHNYIDARGRSKYMTGNISYLLDFQEFDGGYVTFGGGVRGGKITGKGLSIVGDEAVHKELGDRMERAATTDSSLETEQDSDAQTRFETTSKKSNDPPFSRVNTLGSREDSMKLMELMPLRPATTDIGLEAGQGSGTMHKTPTRPHDSPLPRVHTLGIEVLENDMQQTKKVYSSALTKLILRVKKLEKKVKKNKARRRARIVISEDEDAEEDSSKQGRKISEIDKDPTISLVQPEQDILISNKVKEATKQEGNWHEEAIRYGKNGVRGGKKAINEEENQRIARDAKIAKQLQEEFNRARQEQEVVAEADQAHDIDWSDPAMLRYHALQNRSFSVAEARKNMCMYLKNQGGYKQSHFKGMSYEDIRPIFERNKEIESKQVEEDMVQQEDVVAEQVMIESSKKAGGRLKRKVLNARKDKNKRQKMQDDLEKLTLKEYVEVISDSEEVISVIPLAVKSPIVS
ncbi:hypothetical protein Tco_0993250 [Tanacetum coccineum]|uniref:Uncharacterized protein n=1 Tax=Tanacetum coccineum TaxID=301880 RepID=A0ABQ5F4E0_9ASTR